MAQFLREIELALLACGLVLTLPLLSLFVLHTVAFLLPRRRTSSEARLSPVKRLVIVVPAHNEATHIERTLSSLLISAEGTEVRILLIAHNCTDDTAKIARRCGVLVKELSEAEGGKGRALSYAFRTAFQELGADSVMVVDADSVVSTNALTVALEELQTHRAIQLRYALQGNDVSQASAMRELAFTCFNQLRPLARQRLGISCGLFGNGFALRRELLSEISYSAHSMVEDLEFHIDLVKAGYKVQYIDRATVFAGVVQNWKDSETQTARWEGGRLKLLRKQYLALLLGILKGRLRLMEPLLDLAGLPIALFVLFAGLLAALPLHASRLYALLCFTLLVLHVGTGLCLVDRPVRYISLIWYVPVYVLYKLDLLPRVLETAWKDSPWQRTPRATIDPKPRAAP